MTREENYRSQFRIPYSLYEALLASARQNRRSLNAEIVARLQESISASPDQGANVVHDQDVADQLAEMAKRLEQFLNESQKDREEFAKVVDKMTAKNT